MSSTVNKMSGKKNEVTSYVVPGSVLIIIAISSTIISGALFYFLSWQQFAHLPQPVYKIIYQVWNSNISNPVHKNAFRFFLILIYFLLYQLAFFVLLEVAAFLILLCTSKWKKPAVFISYKRHGAIEDTYKIAETLRDELIGNGFNVHFRPYNESDQHDDINFDVREKLRKSNVMVTVPDLCLSSYATAEILAAFIAYKPVYIIKYSQDQKLPDTANTGHTVLMYDQLKKHNYKPLFNILEYSTNVLVKRLFIIKIPFDSYFNTISKVFDFIGKDVFAVVLIGIAISSIWVPITLFFYLVKIIVLVLAFVASFKILQDVYRRLQLEKVVKQRKAIKTPTHQEYKETGLDEISLSCIDKIGLKM